MDRHRAAGRLTSAQWRWWEIQGLRWKYRGLWLVRRLGAWYGGSTPGKRGNMAGKAENPTVLTIKTVWRTAVVDVRLDGGENGPYEAKIWYSCKKRATGSGWRPDYAIVLSGNRKMFYGLGPMKYDTPEWLKNLALESQPKGEASHE